MLKFFKTSYFPNCMMDFVHIWYDDRYSSQVFIQQYPAHAYDLTVKVTNLKKFILKFFKSSYIQTLQWILFIFGMMIDTGPKFYSAMPPAHAHGPKVKVKNLEIIY